jgi:hypothetical protein
MTTGAESAWRAFAREEVKDMKTLTVKSMPLELYERLKLSAKANHRSLNNEIIVCIIADEGRELMQFGLPSRVFCFQ